MKFNLSTEKGRKKLQAELNTVQTYSKAGTVTVPDISAAADYIFRELHISRKALEGSRFCVDLHAGTADPGKARRSTIVALEYRHGVWFVTNLYRGHTRRTGHEVDSALSETAKEAVVRRFDHFTISGI